jgi:hypothetical protein
MRPIHKTTPNVTQRHTTENDTLDDAIVGQAHGAAVRRCGGEVPDDVNRRRNNGQSKGNEDDQKKFGRR